MAIKKPRETGRAARMTEREEALATLALAKKQEAATKHKIVRIDSKTVKLIKVRGNGSKK